MQKLVYISGALSDVPEAQRARYIELYELIGAVVESVGLVPYVPHMNTDPVKHKDVTPRAVDLIDRRAVTSAVLVIAVLDNPSLGVGIEIEMAHHAAKPVVTLCQQDILAARRISRLARGNPAVIAELSYTDREDALRQIRQFVLSFVEAEGGSIIPSLLKPTI